MITNERRGASTPENELAVLCEQLAWHEELKTVR